MKYLNNIKTIEELKKYYRVLAKELHPDLGGNEENFKILVNEYEILLAKLQKEEKTTTEEKELNEQYMNIINKLINIDNLIIEVIGSWIWLSGDTYNSKDIIKELGFKWAAKKKMWYLAPSDSKRKYSKKELSINEIKQIHGVTASYKSKQTKKLA